MYIYTVERTPIVVCICMCAPATQVCVYVRMSVGGLMYCKKLHMCIFTDCVWQRTFVCMEYIFSVVYVLTDHGKTNHVTLGLNLRYEPTSHLG